MGKKNLEKEELNLPKFGASKLAVVLKAVVYTILVFVFYGWVVRPLLDSKSDMGYIFGLLASFFSIVIYAWLIYMDIRRFLKKNGG